MPCAHLEDWWDLILWVSGSIRPFPRVPLWGAGCWVVWWSGVFGSPPSLPSWGPFRFRAWLWLVRGQVRYKALEVFTPVLGKLIRKHVFHAWHAAATTDAHHTDPQGCAPLWGEVSLPKRGVGCCHDVHDSLHLTGLSLLLATARTGSCGGNFYFLRQRAGMATFVTLRCQTSMHEHVHPHCGVTHHKPQPK